MKSIEEIKTNYDKYIKAFTKYFGKEVTEKFEDLFAERIALAPRGITDSEGGYEGGLIDFALSTAKKCKMFGDDPALYNSLIRVALLHELGKLGDIENEQFLVQDSQWHKEKLGQNYKFNDACHKMTFVHRTQYIISLVNLLLTQDEWVAIITSGGFHSDESKFYGRDNHVLSHAFQLCRAMSENELKTCALGST